MFQSFVHYHVFVCLIYFIWLGLAAHNLVLAWSLHVDLELAGLELAASWAGLAWLAPGLNTL